MFQFILKVSSGVSPGSLNTCPKSIQCLCRAVLLLCSPIPQGCSAESSFCFCHCCCNMAKKLGCLFFYQRHLQLYVLNTFQLNLQRYEQTQPERCGPHITIGIMLHSWQGSISVCCKWILIIGLTIVQLHQGLTEQIACHPALKCTKNGEVDKEFT